MDRYDEGHYGSGENFRTHRSERYRHPERDSNVRFDDYGSSARGGYGDVGHSGTWGNQGNEMGGSRNVSRDRNATYSSSGGYGSRGSFGSSQSYGSSRGINPSQRSDQGSYYHYESGMGPSSSDSTSGRRTFGYSSDYDSHGSGYSYDQTPNLYGSNVSRRFQGSGQDNYSFNRDRMQNRSGLESSSSYWDRDNYSPSRSEGNYMGSGYSRSTRGTSSGDYGSMGYYNREGSSGDFGRSSGMSSGSSGRFGSSQQHDPYARDTENTRILHPDSDYDYDPNHSFDPHNRPNFVGSHNRNRTWSRDRDRDRDRDFERY